MSPRSKARPNLQVNFQKSLPQAPVRQRGALSRAVRPLKIPGLPAREFQHSAWECLMISLFVVQKNQRSCKNSNFLAQMCCHIVHQEVGGSKSCFPPSQCGENRVSTSALPGVRCDSRFVSNFFKYSNICGTK